jgi:hypothetical protein
MLLVMVLVALSRLMNSDCSSFVLADICRFMQLSDRRAAFSETISTFSVHVLQVSETSTSFAPNGTIFSL